MPLTIILVSLFIFACSCIYIASAHSLTPPHSLLGFLLTLHKQTFLFWSSFVARLSGKMPTILVTGGAGYIGTHTVLQLLLGGYKAVVVDNLDNASEIALKRVQELAGKQGSNLVFHKVFICCQDCFFSSIFYLGFVICFVILSRGVGGDV